jgi:putative transposase
MARKRLLAEQIATKLRRIEVLQGQGKTIATACKEIGTTEQIYYRWRKEYGSLGVDQAKRLKQLETENGRLKKLVADLSLEKKVLQDIAQGNL